MSAESFWSSHKAGEKYWVQKHKIAWWKSKCKALEYENYVLRNKLKELSMSKGWECQPGVYQGEENIAGDENGQVNNIANGNNEEDCGEYEEEYGEYGEEEGTEGEEHEEDELEFLECSFRHKMELKKSKMHGNEYHHCKNDASLILSPANESVNRLPYQHKLLYGSYSNTIIKMEVQLQELVEHNTNFTKTHYWPNIPLRMIYN